MRWAEAALIPGWIGAQWLWHPIRQCDALPALDGLSGDFGIVTHPLGIDAIIVLADRQIKCAENVGPVHINLHLDVVGWLRLLDTVIDHIVKRLLRVRLELSHMALERCLWDTRLNDAIKAP